MECPGCGFDYPPQDKVCPRCHNTLASFYSGRPLLPEGTTLQGGSYRIEGRIGRGASSIVYSGVEVRMGVRVAIKEFFPLSGVREGLAVGPRNPRQRKAFLQEREEFLEEGRLLTRFDHPGIARMHATLEENETAYHVMELLQGNTLHALTTERGGRLSQEEVMVLLGQVPRALETMHLYGLLHGDLKPENLILTEDGRLVLLDFGSAHRYLTGTNQLRQLTPAYAAPEQLTDPPGKLGPYTDVYGLAVTLYQVLAGVRPTPALQRLNGEGLKNLLEHRPDLDIRLADGITQALALDPRRRPQTMKDLMRLLMGARARAAVAEPCIEEVWALQGFESGLIGLDSSADGRTLAAGSEDGAVWLWDVELNETHRALLQPGLTALQIAPGANWLMLASLEGEVRLWDLVRERDLKLLKRGMPRVEALGRTPDGGWLGAACSDGRACCWKSPGNTFVMLVGHKRPASCIAFAPDGMTVATGSADLTIRLWVPESGEMLRILEGHQKQVQGLAFSPDGTQLASVATDRTVRLWDVASGTEVRCYDCSSPLCVCFSPDGELVAVGSLDGFIRVFLVREGRKLAELKGHEGGVRGLLFLPDGRMASASVDTTVRLWEVIR